MCRNMTLIFRPEESSLRFTIAIFDDDLPEIDEQFTVGVTLPSGGARIGQQASASITILTNDNAHGLIGFSNSSQSLIVSEMVASSVISLDVERQAGSFGLVIVDWELSGGHMTGEITPASGQVRGYGYKIFFCI